MKVVIPFLLLLLVVYILYFVIDGEIKYQRFKKFNHLLKKQLEKISEAIDNADNK